HHAPAAHRYPHSFPTRRSSDLAGYVAKYATKGTRLTEGSDYRIRSAEHIEQLPITEHHKQLMRTAWRLGGLPEFEELNLRKWAQDRKSTRLNSSHRTISYAVFC